MHQTTLRRTGALIASAALLASLTVAAIAAPAVAEGPCQPWTADLNGTTITEGCYVWNGVDINASGMRGGAIIHGGPNVDIVHVVAQGTFYGGGGDDEVRLVSLDGTFYGGPGDEKVSTLSIEATFYGGPGDDEVRQLFVGTFHGGAGDDKVTQQVGGQSRPAFFYGGGGCDFAVEVATSGTFVGGGGHDHAGSVQGGGTFAGGGGRDTYGRDFGGTISSATQGSAEDCS